VRKGWDRKNATITNPALEERTQTLSAASPPVKDGLAVQVIDSNQKAPEASAASKPPEADMFAPELYGNRALNNTQRRVVELVAQGLKNSEIAERIGTTEHVVKNYLRIIYDKLGFHNRVEIALWYEARQHSEKSN
jgi:DNA-binding NarL/FixJ family response regulator